MLFRRAVLGCAVCLAVMVAPLLTAPASAQGKARNQNSQSQGKDSGLVGLHTLSRVGGKICMADHYHTGSSSGLSSRKAAEATAIRNWQDFTAWEYGGAWGSFALAESKKVVCSGGGSWGCDIEGRACRRR